MTRTHAVAIGLAATLVVAAASAAADHEDVQAPRSQTLSAPRGQDDVQAPRGHDEVQAPRSRGPVETPQR